MAKVNIKIEGEVDASKGYFYTTAGGANVYSEGSGVLKMNTCTDGITYQYSLRCLFFV